jgi:3-hydroxyisobutyrate dehydrogenase-like beta-hydroxyacid dehydrogenase
VSLVVGVLHPGEMGAAIAAQLRRRDTRVLWCPEGRSARTAERATAAGLEPVDDLAAFLTEAEIVLSICPPEFAEDVARQVAENRFQGWYVEANAISPRRCHRIASRLTAGGVRVIDGSIIGPPPTDPRSARLYLAGDDAATGRVAELFAGTSAEAVTIDGPVGTASALKMAYASFQKASRALAAVAHALAASHGVTEHLLTEAARSTRSPLVEPDYLPSVAARAWRWAPEMHEIADTLAAENLPPDLAIAAGKILAHWSADKGLSSLSLDALLDRLSGTPASQ